MHNRIVNGVIYSATGTLFLYIAVGPWWAVGYLGFVVACVFVVGCVADSPFKKGGADELSRHRS